MIDGDLLSIILSDELYCGDDEKIKDELTILFLAGNETIKISSTNTVCQLVRHPEVKSKFLQQVSPVIMKAADNLVDGLTIDDVERFDYVRWCWYEAMRLEPPAPRSMSN